MNFESILFPIDSSPRCAAAAPYVAALADRFRARVITVHAAAEDELSTDEAIAVARVRRVVRPERTRHITMFGDPVKVIVEVARKEQAGLIVLPTRGVSRMRRFWSRSVAAAVVQRVTCPVIIWTEECLRWANRDIRNVLCATALGPESKRALGWATGLAKRLQAELDVVHADTSLQSVPAYPCDGEWRTWVRRHVRDEMKRTLRDAGAEGAGLWIQAEDPADAIAGVADEVRADLVVVGRSSRRAGLLSGSRARSYDIARQAACPVAIV